MRITVVGGGAIGLLLSAKLIEAGLDPVVVTRTEEQARLLESDGVRITHVDSSFSLHKTKAVPSSYLTSPVDTDWIFVTVKQTGLDPILPILKKIRVKYGLIAFQNGMGHMERMEGELSYPLFMAITSEGAYRRGLNEVVHAGVGNTRVGPWKKVNEGNKESEGLNQLITSLKKLGMEIARDDDIYIRAWRKLLINCTINPLTALYEIPNGELIVHGVIRDLMRSIWEEAVAVAAREGVVSAMDTWEELLQVCRNTSRNRSSMLQDIEKGKKTEIDYLNGYIVERGKAFQLPVETNRALVSLIHGKEQILKEKRVDQ